MRRGVSAGRLAALGLIASTVSPPCASPQRCPCRSPSQASRYRSRSGGLVPAAAFASVPLVAVSARAIGPINGLLAQAGSLGSLAGPPLLALWVEGAGWASAPVLLLAIAAVGAACALAVGRR